MTGNDLNSARILSTTEISRVPRTFQPAQEALFPQAAGVSQSCRWKSCSRVPLGEAVLRLTWVGKWGLKFLGTVLVTGSRWRTKYVLNLFIYLFRFSEAITLWTKLTNGIWTPVYIVFLYEWIEKYSIVLLRSTSLRWENNHVNS